MINYLKSENLKYKHTFSRKLIVIAPLFFLLFAFFTQSNLEADRNYYMEMVFNQWPLIFMIEGSALLCVLSNLKDNKSGGYKSFFMSDINISKFWLSKIFIVAFYMLISTIILILVVFISSVLFQFTDNAPVLEICIAGLTIWITSIGMVPVYLFLASCFGTAAAVISGIVGMALGVIVAPKPEWIFVPWSWALRLMSPIVGVHPNGMALPPNDVMRNSSVIPLGIIVSIIFFIATCYLTCIWFSKREEY